MVNREEKLSAETDFLTGVVEGFYGRPWTYPQRKELFRRMNHMGMNSYLYAPKDDLKHRQSWRDLYSAEEEQQLHSLITEARDFGILFIFALSPGLDVTFSSVKEMEILKKKVDQVSKLGCQAFALLFDDIEPRLCPADRGVFSSSARAQVAFANDLYSYLNCPSVFLFCPTEYCASLAVPCVEKSDYLSTIASHLAPGIAVVWTGPLVVSKSIPTSDVQELSKLLKHPIVIWDNLHANDYDQRRVFIGPYSGRPLALRREGLLRGVLTNPNCEFEANYVALHTLAQWSRYGQLKCSSVSSDKEMTEENATAETEPGQTDPAISNGAAEDSDAGSDISIKSGNARTYRPREALMVALRDWLTLMLQYQHMTQPSSQSGTARGTPTPMETDSTEPTQQPAPEVLAECATTLPNADTPCSDLGTSVDVTLEDLQLFADLFYLPFAHGPAGLRLLELGHWLREHSYACGPNSTDPEKNVEWIKKLAEFMEMVSSIAGLRDRIQRLPSRSIAYELVPYITEMHVVLGIVLDYFRWLETGVMAYRSMCHLRRLLTWFSPGYRDMVTSGDQEPWTFRGGLITELQRILPLESAQDLFPAPSRALPGVTTIPNLSWPDLSTAGLPGSAMPFVPAPTPLLKGSVRSHAYIVRPYRPEDKPLIYALFRRLLLTRLGLPDTILPAELKDLPGDRYLLHFLEHSPETCMIVEGPSFISSANQTEEHRFVGFGLSAASAVTLARDRAALYKQVLRNKYASALASSVESLASESPSQSEALEVKEDISSSQSSIPSAKPLMSSEDFIKFLLQPFHAETTVVADIIDAAAALPPPEPLGAALPTEPALSGCLESADSEVVHHSGAPPNVCVNTSSTIPMECPPKVPSQPAPLLPDTAPPSPPSANQPNIPDSQSSSPTIPTPTRPVLVTGSPEALHTALTAHPATLWVEFDDLDIVSYPNGPPPTMLMNHSLGLSADPPELVLDSVARRLFICLLAALKTIGAHGSHVQLDTINEHRAELYRRFGFYPVPAASTEQMNVLARLI